MRDKTKHSWVSWPEMICLVATDVLPEVGFGEIQIAPPPGRTSVHMSYFGKMIDAS